MVQIGDEVKPVVRDVTQEKINRWAKVSGDFNPLHVDPEFAKSTMFGGTISHGPMSIAFLSDMMARWLGTGWTSGGHLEVTFLGPVRPGDTVTARGKVIEKQEEDDKERVLCEVFCENQKGEKVIVGKASGLISES